jgi:putative transposase
MLDRKAGTSFERARRKTPEEMGFSPLRDPLRPTREHATNNRQTYMITTETWQRRTLFRNERWAKLMADTLYHYRGSAYLLHEFVIMPDHIHVLITPITSLEKAIQFIKGGFSYRAKKELGSNLEIWQKGFQDQRIRDAADYDVQVNYIRQNPVRQRLRERAEEYPYSSFYVGFELDEVPQGLKPITLGVAAGAPEGAPFQNNVDHRPTEPFHDKSTEQRHARRASSKQEQNCINAQTH